MAKRRTVSTRRSGNTEIVVVEPRVPAVAGSSRMKRRSRRRSGSRASGFGTTKKAIGGAAIGGAIYGFIEKTFPSIPSVPVLGKSGTVALICYLAGDRHPLLRDVGVAAASIAGYTLAKDGAISGYDDDHGMAIET